jgi:hypothetical protein
MAIELNGTTGITTPGLTNTGTETIVNLTTTGNTILGDASTDTLNVGNGSIVTDGAGNTGFNGTATNYGATYRGIWLNAPAIPIMDFSVNGTRTLSVLATSTTPTIKTVTNTPLIFGTNDTERMRIEAAGTLTVTGAVQANFNYADLAQSSYGAGTSFTLTVSDTTEGAMYLISVSRNVSSLSASNRVSLLSYRSNGSFLTDIIGNANVTISVSGATITVTGVGTAVLYGSVLGLRS